MWVALCHWDCWAGWRCVIVIGGQGRAGWTRLRVVCAVGPRHCKWWAGLRVGGAVSSGLLGKASCGWRCHWDSGPGWRCVVVIGGQGVVWVALCRCDWWGGRRVGGAVSLGLLGRASCWWRCVIGIGGQGVVWVALCHWDRWAGCCCVIEIAGQGVVW